MSEDWVNFVGKEEREGNGAHHVDSARDAGDALPFLACQQATEVWEKEQDCGRTKWFGSKLKCVGAVGE